VRVKNGKVILEAPVVILRAGQGQDWKLFPCELMGGVIQ
jgi:hypothetical protein